MDEATSSSLARLQVDTQQTSENCRGQEGCKYILVCICTATGCERTRGNHNHDLTTQSSRVGISVLTFIPSKSLLPISLELNITPISVTSFYYCARCSLFVGSRGGCKTLFKCDLSCTFGRLTSNTAVRNAIEQCLYTDETSIQLQYSGICAKEKTRRLDPCLFSRHLHPVVPRYRLNKVSVLPSLSRSIPLGFVGVCEIKGGRFRLTCEGQDKQCAS